VREQNVCGGLRRPPGSPPLIAGGYGDPRKYVHLGHQPGVPRAAEQLHVHQDDGCDQEQHEYDQKLELFSLN
jgi:hypothetical protein